MKPLEDRDLEDCITKSFKLQVFSYNIFSERNSYMAKIVGKIVCTETVVKMTILGCNSN